MSNLGKNIIYTPTEVDSQNFSGLTQPVSGHISKDNGSTADLIIWPHVEQSSPLKIVGIEQGEGAGKYQLA